MSFDTLGLLPELLKAVRDEGYTVPTPIQIQAIPAVLGRRDVMGCAQTGTGKTAGFALPILQILAPGANSSPSPARHPIRCLVLAPTRELAAQIEESFKAYGRHLALRSTVVFGGMDIHPQIAALRAGVEVLVATPGRLLDHVQQKTVNLSRVEILVLDEADRMLDMGFMPDIKRILSLLPAARQNLLFSATFSDEIRRLSKDILRLPVVIEVAARNTPAELVTHTLFEIDAARKRALLAHLVRTRDMKQVLVFVRTKRDANRLMRELVRDGLAATAIHSDRTQTERMEALEAFKAGRVAILVATDIAARGLDIEHLPFVVNYELPYVAEDYVHRIGRTGRAGLPGEAIALVSPDEMRFLADIEKLLHRKIERSPLPELEGRAPRGSSGRSREHEHRAPAPARAHAPAPARPHAHASAPARAAQPPKTADGFDFTKPYEPAGATETAPPTAVPSRKPGRQVAALLGGLARRKPSH